jgi:hypothetical protein
LGEICGKTDREKAILEEKRLIRKARYVLGKLDKRIKMLMKERESIAKALSELKVEKGTLAKVKVCPFCGGAINPFEDITSRRYADPA